MGGDASFFLPSGLADDEDEETIVLGGGIGHGLTLGGLLPSTMWEPSNDPTLDSSLAGANERTLGQGSILRDVQDSNTLYPMNTTSVNNMQSFYLHQPVQSDVGPDLNTLNSYSLGNRKPPGFPSNEQTARTNIHAGSQNTIDEPYYPSQPEGFGVQNYGAGSNANMPNPNFNLNESFPSVNHAINQNSMFSPESVSNSNANDLSGNGRRRQPQIQGDVRSNDRNTANATLSGKKTEKRVKQQYNEAAVKSASAKKQNGDYASVDFDSSAISATQQRLLSEHRQRQAQNRGKQSITHDGQEMKPKGGKWSRERSSKEFIAHTSKKSLPGNSRGNKRASRNNNRSRPLVAGAKDYQSINDQQPYGTKKGDSQYNNLQYDDDDDEEEDEEEDDPVNEDGDGAFVGGANDATNTLRKRNVGNNKSKSRSKHSQNKSSKNTKSRSPSMSFDDDEDLPSLLRKDIQNRKRSVSSGMHDIAGNVKFGITLFSSKTISNATSFFFSVSRILETAFSMIGVCLSFALILGINVVSLVWMIHASIGKICSEHAHVGLAYSFTYFFPFVVSYSIPWAPPWGPVCLWYAFLVQVFWPSESGLKNGTGNAHAKWLIPILFLMEGVSHRSFLLDFTGNQRLLVAFAVASFHSPRKMKNLLYVLSLGVQIFLSSYMNDIILMQWVQFIHGINCLGYCLSSDCIVEYDVEH